MLKDNMLAYAEVDEILNLIEDEYREKVPENIRNFFKKERNKEYISNINPDKPLMEQNLRKETIVLLGILNLNYWCNSEEEKEQFLKRLAENDRKKITLEEKYNIDNLFKNKTKNDKVDNLDIDKLQIIEYKEKNFIQKILDKIMKIFNNKNKG